MRRVACYSVCARHLAPYTQSTKPQLIASPAPPPPRQTADLLAKSAANKALNDKKRLATSSANVARGRTVADKTCVWPNNVFGCESLADKFTGGVKYIADDKAIECEVRSGAAFGKDHARVSRQPRWALVCQRLLA